KLRSRPDSQEGEAHLEGMSQPPPARRIVVDREPTVVPQPAGERQRNGHSPVGLVSGSRRKRPAGGAGLGGVQTEELSVAYGEKLAVKHVTLSVRQGEVLALIGPSGCGKTTLLRSLNRLVELTPTARRSGRITLDSEDVDAMDATRVRRRVTMVFQQ